MHGGPIPPGSQRELIYGDCIEHMRSLPDNCIDCVVCDPPYGLGFMGRKWDKRPPGPEWAAEVLRVTKPGGHIIAFGGQRTIHRLTVVLEDAGWEIRDQIGWLYYSGFPKSLNIAIALDKAAGVIGHRGKGFNVAGAGGDPRLEGVAGVGRPPYQGLTEEARRWQGWGSGLKPSLEPCVLARKPLSEKNIAQNVQRWGTGGLNIDGCRYAYGDRAWPGPQGLDLNGGAYRGADSGARGCSWSVGRDVGEYSDPGGRFPANVYYCPKANRKEREAGCEALEAKAGHEAVDRKAATAGVNNPRAGAGRTADEVKNYHPTVKPIALMRWLCRLVCPPDGIVFDPFMGSGTTGCAAVLEGFRFIGCELDAGYLCIAAARVEHWAEVAKEEQWTRQYGSIEGLL